MKKITGTLIICIILLISGCTTQRDLAQIELENAEQEALYQRAIDAINSQDFVLEANRATFRRGVSKFVNPNTNFVSLNGNKATVQLAFNTYTPGPNGIGGITVSGNASNMQTTTDRRGNTTFRMTVLGANISAIVTIILTKDTHQCTATVNPSFNSNRINFSGFIYPTSESRIFRGRTL